jgi:hypothetical protein
MRATVKFICPVSNSSWPFSATSGRRSTLRSDIGNTAFAAAACDVELDRAEIRTYLGAI